MQKKMGENCVIDHTAEIGNNVIIGHNCIIEADVIIGSKSYIDSNTIIRRGTCVGENSFIGSNCIIGEYLMNFCQDRIPTKHSLCIGKNSIIRSGSIIYTDSIIGDDFQSGHQVTIREKTKIGNHVSVGTLSDIQGNCVIGNYVRMHSNVHVGQLSEIEDFVWLFPYVVLTNDPTPPSNNFVGVHIRPFAIVATGVLIMPGIEIGQDSLLAAGCIVTKNVEPYAVIMGNPGKVKGDVRNIKSKLTGENIYPWRLHFTHYMPWEESDFNSWYNSLDLPTKKDHKIDKLVN